MACGFFLRVRGCYLSALRVACDERVKIAPLLLVARGKERPYAFAALLAQGCKLLEKRLDVGFRKKHCLAVVDLHLDVDDAVLIGVFERLLFFEKGFLRLFFPCGKRLAPFTRLRFRHEAPLLQILLLRCKPERLVCERGRLHGALCPAQALDVSGERRTLPLKLRKLRIRLMRLLGTRQIDDADAALFLLCRNGGRRHISKEKECAAEGGKYRADKSAAKRLFIFCPKGAPLPFRLFLRHLSHLPKSPCIQKYRAGSPPGTACARALISVFLI